MNGTALSFACHFAAALSLGATPREIVGRLSGEVVAILGLPDVRTSLQTQGAEPGGNSPDAFTAFVKSEIEKWTKVVKSAGLRAD